MPAGINTQIGLGIRRMIRSLPTPQYRNFEVNGTQLYQVNVAFPVGYTYTYAGAVRAPGATIPYDAGSVTRAPAPAAPAAALAAGGTLVVGTPYFYVITAVVGGIEGLQSAEVTATPTTGNQTVNLSWTAVAGATGYRVYRSTATGSYVSPALIGTPTAVSLSDTGLAVGAGAPSTGPVYTLYSNLGQLERDFNSGWINPVD
jgi:hypothetical protein